MTTPEPPDPWMVRRSVEILGFLALVLLIAIPAGVAVYSLLGWRS